MTKKTWVALKRGLITDPKHRETLGIRVWFYLYILDRANWEKGAVTEWRDEAEAEAMAMPVRTLQEQRRQLEADGYITCTQKPHCQTVVIHRYVNPREYTGQVYNVKAEDPPDVAGAHESEGSRNLLPSDDDEGQGSIEGYIEGSIKGYIPPSAPFLRFKESNVKESEGGPKPERTSRDQTPWIHALLALKKTLNKADYDTWVRDTEILSISNGSVIIGARNTYGAEWLREHVALNVAEALAHALGRPVKVAFEVAPPSPLPSSLGE